MSSGRSWPAERPEADVDERLRVDLDAGRVAQAGGEALAVGAAHAPEGAPEGGVEGQRLEARERGGIAGPPRPQRQGEQLGEARVSLGQPAPGKDRRRPRAQRLAPQDGQVRERLRGRPFPGRRHVGVRGADHRERSRPEPPRLTLAEQRQPAAALAVAGPERLGLVEVAAVDLVQDLEEPRLLGLEEREEPEGAARLALGAAEAGERGRARAGPRLVPAEPLLVEKQPHHLGHREGAALVGQEEHPRVGQRGAHRPGDEGELLPEPLRVPRVRGGRGRKDVSVSGVPGGAQGGQQLGRALGPGLGGDDVDVPGGAHRPILPQPGPPEGARASCGIVRANGPRSELAGARPALRVAPVARRRHRPRRPAAGHGVRGDRPLRHRQVRARQGLGPPQGGPARSSTRTCARARTASCRARCAAPAWPPSRRRRRGGRGLVGDDDPLDILVLTEKDFTHGNILVQALPIGGLGMLDGSEVDDKIVAVMVKDAVYGGVQDIAHLPTLLVDRLKHYFLTYKQAPSEAHPACELTRVYGREEAFEVIRRSQDDYLARFGGTLGPLVAKG